MEITRSVEIGRRIHAARVLSGKTVSELAREIGVSKRTLWRLEAGERPPNLIEAEALATATDQSVDFFLGNTSAEPGAAVLPPPLPSVKD